MLYLLLMEGMGSSLLLGGTALLIGDITGLQTPTQVTSKLFPGGTLGWLLTEIARRKLWGFSPGSEAGFSLGFTPSHQAGTVDFAVGACSHFDMEYQRDDTAST
jgi:hypothetical protein